MTLLERYKPNLAVAAKLVGKNGNKFTHEKAAILAQCLKNSETILNEAFETNAATQVNSVGKFRKFVMQVSTASMPNLIAYDLVITKPMSSLTGYITYTKYSYGTEKGGVASGTEIQSPFHLSGTDSTYTSKFINQESFTPTGTDTLTANAKWIPVITGTTEKPLSVVVTGTKDGAVVATTNLIAGDGETDGTINLATGAFAFSPITTGEGEAAVTADKFHISYYYDNMVIPANDLPTLTMTQEGLYLQAEPRRIAIRYSTLAALIAKTDYDIDMSSQLVKKATSQLNFEIDREIVGKLAEAAETEESLNWSKELPMGVSKAEHYQGFMEIVETASAIIYERTSKYSATYMVVGSRVKPVLSFIRGWNPVTQGSKVGPYMCGTLDGMKVFIDPSMKPNSYFFGVKGDDLETAAAVFAPYLPVIPTQLLETADHGAQQGFATLYDFKIINERLLVAGSILEN